MIITLDGILILIAIVFAVAAALNVISRFNLLAIAIALFLVTLMTGCASAPTWQARLAPDSLATQTVVAVAEHYGGKDASNLASAGLYATAEVLQGYVDKKPPLDIIVQSPGVEGVSHILLDWLKNKGVVTQATVDAVHKAAAFAARVTWTADPK